MPLLDDVGMLRHVWFCISVWFCIVWFCIPTPGHSRVGIGGGRGGIGGVPGGGGGFGLTVTPFSSLGGPSSDTSTAATFFIKASLCAC